ncbi:MAG: glycosyltransferase [Bacteroidales bacterium]|nr:glycosyltransferase [Bacteroidales bacterium]
MKLSVVTIVFNDVLHIEKTMNSVFSQTYKNIEYIIIDGNSTDGTKELINKYEDKLNFWISKPDNGLYDAMNKGLKKVTGDYVCFLNSGDLFYDEKTVEQIFYGSINTDVDVFYGDTLIVDDAGNIKGKRRHRPPKELSWKSFKNGMLVSHQAFIPSLKITPLYDLNYKYSADFDWCIKILKKAKNIKNTNANIIRYLDGGLTKKRFKASLKERFKIMVNYYGFITTLWVHIRNAVKMSFFAFKNKWV